MGTKLHLLEVSELKLRTKPRSLPFHVVDQLRSLNTLRPSRKVLDEGSDTELSTRLVAFQNQRFQVGASAVDCRCQSGTAGTKNYGVTCLCHELSQLIVDGEPTSDASENCGGISCNPLPVDGGRHHPSVDKMINMANLTLVYGMRLLPAGEVVEIGDATLKLANGNDAHVTMHVLEGSREQIEAQLKQSLDAFFDFYPEI
jgi:hypothetical protein